MRARLPGAASMQWLTTAWTDTGRATAAATTATANGFSTRPTVMSENRTLLH